MSGGFATFPFTKRRTDWYAEGTNKTPLAPEPAASKNIGSGLPKEVSDIIRATKPTIANPAAALHNRKIATALRAN
jgi:hypothetical protein